MQLSLAYWILMLLWLIGGGWSSWPAPGAPRQAWWPFGGTLIAFFLFAILGWAIFGPAIHR